MPGMPGTQDESRPVCCLGMLYSQAMVAAPRLLQLAAGWSAQIGADVELLPRILPTDGSQPCDEPNSGDSAPSSESPALICNDRNADGGAGSDTLATPSCMCNGRDCESGLSPSLKALVRGGAVKEPDRAVLKALLCYNGDVSRLTDLCRCRLLAPGAAGVAACLRTMTEDPNVRVVKAVVVNLVMVDKISQQLGIENHVCEIQLVPSEYATLLQDPVRHHRYRQLRFSRLLSTELSPHRCRPTPIHESFLSFFTQLRARMRRSMRRLLGRGLDDSGSEATDLTVASLKSIMLGAFRLKGCATSVTMSISQPHEDVIASSMVSTSAALELVAKSDLDGENNNKFQIHTTEVADTSAFESKLVVEKINMTGCSHQSQGGFTGHMAGNNDTTNIAPILPHGIVQAYQDANSYSNREIDFEADNESTQASHLCLRNFSFDYSEGLLRAHRRTVMQDGGSLASVDFQDVYVSASSIFYTSHPFTVASLKPAFQITLFSVALYNLLWAYCIAAKLSDPPLIFASICAARFTPLGLRDPRVPSQFANNISFGLLAAGSICPIPPTARTTSSGGAPAWVRFDTPVSAEGYYIDLPDGSPELDPVRWIVEVEGSDSNGSCESGVWVAASASAWFGVGKTKKLLPQRSFPVPQDRGITVRVDCRAPWPWLLSNVVTYVVLAIGSLFFSVLGRFGRTHAAVLGLILGISLDAAANFVAGIAYLMLEQIWEGLASLFSCVVDGVLAVFIFIDRPFGGKLLLGFGISKLILMGIFGALLEENLLESLASNMGIVTILLAFVIRLFHRLAVRRAQRLVLVDKDKYDLVWSEVLKDSREQQYVVALGALVNLLHCRSSMLSRQYNRCRLMSTMRESSGSDSSQCAMRSFGRTPSTASGRSSRLKIWSGQLLFDCGIPNSLDLMRPTDSLDQLYYQATALEPLLRGKVCRWAGLSGGYFCAVPCAYGGFASTMGVRSTNRSWAASLRLAFMSRRRVAASDADESIQQEAGRASEVNATAPPVLAGGFVRWANVAEAEALTPGRAVKWGQIKSVQRAMEKSNRSYGKDVSRLLDLCRQSIYFPSLAGIVDCLHAIERDPDVILVRLKNRFDPAFSAAESAGYRNVAVNLRLVTPATMELGIESHVCEVQLLLAQMAAIKNDAGHKKYIMFRNLRGE